MTSLTKSILLKADKEQVWAFLTDPEKLALWFHVPTRPICAAGPYEMFGAKSGDRLMWGDVVVFDPFDRLEMSFSIAPMQGAISHVAWRLETVSGGTQLTLVHSGLPDGVAQFGLALSLDCGWDDHLNRMRQTLNAA